MGTTKIASARAGEKANTTNIPTLYQTICENLPHIPNEDTLVWADGSTILCDNEKVANAVADILEAAGVSGCATGFFDPVTDTLLDQWDKLTGWYYVDC